MPRIRACRATAVGTGAVDDEFGALDRESRWQRRRAGFGDLVQADDLAAALAVKMRMMVIAFGADLEAPGALARGNAARDALRHQPVECPVYRDPVVRHCGDGKCGADFFMRERMRARPQGFDDCDPGSRRTAATGRDQLARTLAVRLRTTGRWRSG